MKRPLLVERSTRAMVHGSCGWLVLELVGHTFAPRSLCMPLLGGFATLPFLAESGGIRLTHDRGRV